MTTHQPAELGVISGSAAAAVPPESIEASEAAKKLGITEERAGGGWFHKLVGTYLRRTLARRQVREAKEGVQVREGLASDAARRAIRLACAKSAFTGFSAGAVSTAATILTAETEGLAGIVTIPVAALTIGGELAYRSIVHVDLVIELAEVFGVRFDAKDERDLWRLYALAFGAHAHGEDEGDPGRELVHNISHVEGEQVGEKIGGRVLGESLARNVIPFVGIFSSAVTNYLVTRRLGDTVRRYMRYQRALGDAFDEVHDRCHAHLDLLVEGLWFIFTADGRLLPEEAACLATFLGRLDPLTRHAVTARFGEDELDWTERIRVVPEEVRDSFFHALEVAAAVDKEIGLPERKILRRAARTLNREFDLSRVKAMIEELEERGVLRQ